MLPSHVGTYAWEWGLGVYALQTLQDGEADCALEEVHSKMDFENI